MPRCGLGARANNPPRLQGNRRYIKCLYVYNKVDMLSIEEVDEIARRPDSLPVSCYLELNMDMLLARMWHMMGLVRVYTKKVRTGARMPHCCFLCTATAVPLLPSMSKHSSRFTLTRDGLHSQVGHKPDFTDPVICSHDRGGTTVKAFVGQISSQLLKEFRYALVWGTSSKHMPQRCGKAHSLEDEGEHHRSSVPGLLT